MLRSIDLSRAAMQRHQQVIEVAAHNTANLNTPGFKAVQAALEGGEAPPSGGGTTSDTGAPPLSARPSTSRKFTQGAISDTGVATEMAINGDGFFIVRRPDGTDGYTRNGSFRTDAGGRLTDAGGNLVQPGITVAPGAKALRIAPNGDVTVTLANGDDQPVGRMRLARFINPQGLQAGGDGLFVATAAAGPAQVAAPGDNGAGSVRIGALEDSNSDLIGKTLMMARHNYQLASSAFQTSDQMLRMAINLKGTGG